MQEFKENKELEKKEESDDITSESDIELKKITERKKSQNKIFEKLIDDVNSRCQKKEKH